MSLATNNNDNIFSDGEEVLVKNTDGTSQEGFIVRKSEDEDETIGYYSVDGEYKESSEKEANSWIYHNLVTVEGLTFMIHNSRISSKSLDIQEEKFKVGQQVSFQQVSLTVPTFGIIVSVGELTVNVKTALDITHVVFKEFVTIDTKLFAIGQQVTVYLGTTERVGYVVSDTGTSLISVKIGEVTYSIARNRATPVDATKALVETKVEPVRHPIFAIYQKVKVTVDEVEFDGVVTAYSGVMAPKVDVRINEKVYSCDKSKVKPTPVYVKPKVYFKDSERTPDEMYMASLFYAKTHEDVASLALDGVDLELYTIVKTELWTALLPKTTTELDKVPCLIAHTDLHPALKHPTVDNLEYEDGRFLSSTGLGADDRAGIFAINQVLKSHPSKFAVLFPDKEEVGLIGSSNFARSATFLDGFDKVASMYISIDRRRERLGGKTIATYGLSNTALNKWVSELTAREVVSGSSTDCRALSGVSVNKVPCFNFSCGYTNEHSFNETLYFSELLETVKDLKLLLDDAKAYTAYEVDEKPTYSYQRYNYEYGYNNYNKKGKTKTTTPSKTNTIYDDMIEVDDTWLFSSDVKILLDCYSYFTGKSFEDKTVFKVSTFKVGDKVFLNEDLIVGQVYGGELLSKALVKSLGTEEWTITACSKELRLELSSKLTTTVCSSIPAIWVTTKKGK